MNTRERLAEAADRWDASASPNVGWRDGLIDALLPVVDALCAERAAEAEPILCPKCQGQGVVSRPSYVPADCATWTSTTAVHRCNLCDGRMVISRARAAALAEADR